MGFPYRGKLLNTSYRADFICFESMLVELKAIQTLTSTDEAQVLNYLKASDYGKALLVNFGARSLEYKRLVFGPRKG
jgi:GxxExxY protein